MVITSKEQKEINRLLSNIHDSQLQLMLIFEKLNDISFKEKVERYMDCKKVSNLESFKSSFVGKVFKSKDEFIVFRDKRIKSLGSYKEQMKVIPSRIRKKVLKDIESLVVIGSSLEERLLTYL